MAIGESNLQLRFPKETLKASFLVNNFKNVKTVE